jgi:hypothetical protein
LGTGCPMSSREGLIGHVDRYLAALEANDPSRVPVTGDVRFTENGQELELGRGLWATAKRVPNHDYAWVADENRSQIEHIEAVLEFVPYGMPTGWRTDT